MRILIPLLALFLAVSTADTRQQLIGLVWGGSLPTRQPDTIETAITDPFWADLSNLARIDRITVRMEYGLESVVYHFIPQIANDQLMIYHEGHLLAGFNDRKKFIQAALARGFTVVAFDMPLLGHNNAPVVSPPGMGHPWQLQRPFHGMLEYLIPETGHPIKYFLEPVIVFLNYSGELDYSHVSMVGVSGGGWTTTLAAAIDQRIQSSFPIAGSLPQWVRTYDWGDWEQSEPDVYRIADYDELYMIGACNGQQVQILYEHDTCCFKADGREQLYDDDVRQRAASLGCDWDLFVDHEFVGHDISPAAEARIFGELAAFGSVEWYYLPLVWSRQ